uniref:SAM domain-containing protein n=1 Tax=Anopheles atroparvus TaxID=41427 RepID=A0AAG5D397_ANOAO
MASSSAGKQTLSSELEANELLEAVLKQMDGIISGDSDYISSPDGGNANPSSNGGLHHGIQSTSILAAAQSLAMALQQQSSSFHPAPDPITADIINTWLDTHLPRQDTDERLRRLQTDKEALAMQVKTLTEQVQTQSSKIIELERTVKEKNQLLSNAEDLLQRVSVFAKTVGIQIDKQKEMLSRSSLETQKLELMSAMSELKLQQAALERENLELRTNFVTSTGGLMNGSLTSGSNGSGSALTNALNNNSITTGLLRRPQIITNTRMVGMSASTPGNSLNSSPMHHGSHGSLPLTAVSPITPKTPPATYRQRIDVHYSSLPRQAFATTLSTVSTSSGSSTATDSNANPKRNVAFGKCSVSYEDYLTHTSKATKQEAEETGLAAISDGNKRSDQRSDRNSVPEFTASASKENHAGCVTHSTDYPAANKNSSDGIHPPFGMSSSMNALSLAAALSGTHGSNLKNLQSTSTSAQELLFDQLASESRSTTRTNADESEEPRQQERANTEPPSPKITDVSKKQPAEIDHKEAMDIATNSLVALTSVASNKDLSKLLFLATPASRPRNHSKIDKLRGFSVPNLAETENGNEDRSEGVPPTRSYTPQPSPSPSMSNKLKNIFGKIKRSNSGTLEDLTGADSEFKRGGIRATAGPRLGWSGTAPYRRPDKPFREWNLDTVCQWFDHLGLSMYEEELSRWLKSSTAPAVELMKASPVDIEKELNLRNPLHRKKIVLAVADVSGSEDEDELFKSAGLLDTSWILRWLDDIGMPQYKEPFTVARMDGRMLHKLTFDDLTLLQMSSCLHVASIRRGIQLMRHEKWHPDCLVRRPLPPDTSTKDDVRLWSSQRVHEWLRAVDLAEYSPNLRGSGVHGALMIYEVKFTAELFADLLNIPASKTLLRRHLATHFKELLGRDIIQVKREAENTLGFQPLTISSKIKTPKKSQFSLKRKKSAKGGQLGEEWSDFVCPMGGSGQEHLPSASYASTANSTNNSNDSPGAPTAFTSNASSNANTNHVTSIGMTKNPSMVPTAYPDSTTSSSTSTTISGVESEPASLPQQLLNSAPPSMTMQVVSGASGGGCGSDSPLSTRSSTTSTS